MGNFVNKVCQGSGLCFSDRPGDVSVVQETYREKTTWLLVWEPAINHSHLLLGGGESGWIKSEVKRNVFSRMTGGDWLRTPAADTRGVQPQETPSWIMTDGMMGVLLIWCVSPCADWKASVLSSYSQTWNQRDHRLTTKRSISALQWNVLCYSGAVRAHTYYISVRLEHGQFDKDMPLGIKTLSDGTTNWIVDRCSKMFGIATSCRALKYATSSILSWEMRQTNEKLHRSVSLWDV